MLNILTVNDRELSGQKLILDLDLNQSHNLADVPYPKPIRATISRTFIHNFLSNPDV